MSRNFFLVNLFILLSSITFSQYCTNDKRFTEVEYFTTNQIKTVTNLIYGEALDVNGKKVTLYMDAYFPDTLVDQLPLRPTIMMIHGGGFTTGNKEQRKAECTAFAQRGYVAFSISYRLGWSSKIENDQAYAMYRAHQDALAALRYIVNQQKKYHIDTNWLFIGGSSAGAVTSHNVVYNTQAEWEKLLPGITTKLGSLVTSTNQLKEKFTLKGVFNNWGAVFSNTINKEEMLPEVSFHGELDETVLIGLDTARGLSGSRTIHEALIKNNVCSELSVDLKGVHGIYTTTEGAEFRTSRASCFFKSIFCNTCSNFYTTDYVLPTCSLDKVTNQLENTEMNEVLAYPNPFSEQLTVTIADEVEKYIIYSSIGTQCFEGTTLEHGAYQHLKTGNYVLKIITREKVYTVPLQKE